MNKIIAAVFIIALLALGRDLYVFAVLSAHGERPFGLLGATQFVAFQIKILLFFGIAASVDSIAADAKVILRMAQFGASRYARNKGLKK